MLMDMNACLTFELSKIIGENKGQGSISLLCSVTLYY